MTWAGNRRAADRNFPPHVTRIDGKPLTVRRIVCSSEGCGFEGEIIDRTSHGMAPPMIEKKFEQKGWTVGANEKHDICPGCAEKQRVERRQRRALQAVNIKLVSTEGENVMPATEVAPIAEKPAEMSREDKRIVFAKLSDVYLDETKGYTAPWTDKTVALDIGVPLAWVAAVRDEMFGPARDNSEVRDMLNRSEVAVADARQLVEDAKKIRAEGAALVARINELNGRASTIGKNLDGLLVLAERIQKAVL